MTKDGTTDPITEAKKIVGTLFHNSDADLDTLERVMIERIAEYLATTPPLPTEAPPSPLEKMK